MHYLFCQEISISKMIISKIKNDTDTKYPQTQPKHTLTTPKQHFYTFSFLYIVYLRHFPSPKQQKQQPNKKQLPNPTNINYGHSKLSTNEPFSYKKKIHTYQSYTKNRLLRLSIQNSNINIKPTTIQYNIPNTPSNSQTSKHTQNTLHALKLHQTLATQGITKPNKRQLFRITH